MFSIIFVSLFAAGAVSATDDVADAIAVSDIDDSSAVSIDNEVEAVSLDAMIQVQFLRIMKLKQ